MKTEWVTLIAFTLVTVISWTVIEIAAAAQSDDVEIEYQSHLDALEPTFNEEVLQDILNREEEYLLVDRDILE